MVNTSVEETHVVYFDQNPISKQIEEFTPLENNRLNSLNDSSLADTDDNKRGSDGKTRFYKACIICTFILITVFVVCTTTLAIILPPRLKEGNSADSNLNKTVKDHQKMPHLPNPVRNERTVGILLFLDQQQLASHTGLSYNVSWKLQRQGFVQGNISFHGSEVYIAKTGIYSISTYLQMHVRTVDKGSRCNLVLNIVDEKGRTNKIHNIHSGNNSAPYRFTMSLTLIYKLEKGQKTYISMSPTDYLSNDDSSSFLSIHKL